jgi:hypothetical protein
MNRLGCQFLLLLVHVLATNGVALAEDLVIAPAEAPMYRLSNLRMESDQFGRSVLAVDYKLTRESKTGSHRARISGKTKGGELNVMGFGGLEKSGTARIRIHMMFGGGNDFEVYFVTDAMHSTKYLVSNIVCLGNPGTRSKARSLTEKEKESIARAKLRATPPASLPEGYVAVDQSTALVPGMSVKAGWYGEWKDAEVISFKVAGPVVLKYDGQSQLESHPREKWIAVDPDVASRATSDPSQFQASVRALPESTAIIPDGAVLLDDDAKLLPGTPLLLNEHGSRWQDVFVIDTQGDKVNLRYKNYSASWDKLHPRNKLVITKDVLSQLDGSDQDAVKKKFAENLVSEKRVASRSAFPTKESNRSEIRHKQYKIDIEIPKGSQLVPDDLAIEKGTALAGCWANKWRPITALYENGDGSLHVHWDDYSDAWDCDMTRDQLIIQDKTIRKLKRKQQPSSGGSTEEELTQVLRTWTDVTGKYKIEARYVSRTEDQVTIKTDAGREIKMPIDKLKESDRDLLPAWQDASDNPFK